MAILYILCGPAGCGKSTWARNFIFAQDHKGNDVRYVSRDDLRFSMLKDDEDYFAHENATFRKFIGTITETLIDGFDVIADATHLNMYARKKLTDAIDKRYSEYDIIYVWFLADADTCVAQNRNRTGRRFVPEHVIRDMCRKFEAPSVAEDPRALMVMKVKGENNE